MGDCNKAYVRPTGYYNFTRFPLQGVIDDVTFYFPTSAHPPPSMIDDSRALPTITFSKSSKLKVTFLYEGAGNRNSLGFFLFNVTNGQNIKYYEEILIPDVSSDNGCLWGGFTIESQRTMQPGERLGFYLRADGFCLTDPPVFYSLPEYNSGPNVDKLRHIGTYLDRYRELLIFGFEDLVGLGDRDYEDTMFFFDTYGLNIDFGNIVRGCTNPPCRNGGTCNWDDGRCDCPKPEIWGGYSCHSCKCDDGLNPCVAKSCTGAQCIPTVWTDTTSSCLQTQKANCSSQAIPCVTQTTSDTYDMSSIPDSSSTSSTAIRTTGRAGSSTQPTSQQTTSSTSDATSSDSTTQSASDSLQTRGTDGTNQPTQGSTNGSNGTNQPTQGSNTGGSNQGTQSSTPTGTEPPLLVESSGNLVALAQSAVILCVLAVFV
eukprot:TRINITY_DN1310_c0_g1_i1.p1 TRINITY_DN1310_c0_g1~~TRINITY_DN1310_c0_g1_i1.p1  ORF type:complete len:456 (-),score=67.67 TRINITY_DN1310_c0_g1_i1:40-1323(-)